VIAPDVAGPVTQVVDGSRVTDVPNHFVDVTGTYYFPGMFTVALPVIPAAYALHPDLDHPSVSHAKRALSQRTMSGMAARSWTLRRSWPSTGAPSLGPAAFEELLEVPVADRSALPRCPANQRHQRYTESVAFEVEREGDS